MKATRLVAVLAAVSIISLGLAACSSSGTSKPTGKVVETATPKATATAKPSAKAAVKVPAVGAKPAPKTAAPVQTQNDVAFDVPANKSGAKKTNSKAKAHAAPAKHPPVVVNPPDVPTQYHPPQVVHP